MARRTKEDAEKTREDILNAASLVFVKKGVAGASLDEIAKEAGVTRGAVYWHFKNKQDIFTALHEKLHVPLTDMILQDLKKNHPEPLSQLEELCVKLMVDLKHNELKRRILTIFFLKCDYSGEFEPVLQRQTKQKKESFSLFNQYFERAITKGHLPKTADARLLTLSVYCCLCGIAQEYIRSGDNFDIEVQAPRVINYLFAGFKLTN